MIDLNNHFEVCLESRRDSHFCSFQTLEGFSQFEFGYKERIAERLNQPEWFYVHVWLDQTIIGQLEFRSTYSEPNTGYVHLIYLKPESRGKGYGEHIQAYIRKKLEAANCKKVLLSVSRINHRAIKHYERFGWKYLAPNPKHELTDFYELKLTI